MAKRARLGEALKGVVGGAAKARTMTGAQAVAAMTGGPAAQEPDVRMTTVRLRPDQIEALRVVAKRRATTKAGGWRDPKRADSSEIIREAVDEWLSKRGGK